MTRYGYSSIISACKRALVAIAASVLVCVSIVPAGFAAVGCTLNDPDRDVKRLFPESTGYRTNFITIKETGGQELYARIQKELGDVFDTVYETIDVPYSFYDVLKGKEVIGHIHGVNQKGTYGGMQLILATDLDGKIMAFYYQKMSSPEASRFMNKEFTGQFKGLTREDFQRGDLKISDPTVDSHKDFEATLRGLKKNLILLKELRVRSESAAAGR